MALSLYIRLLLLAGAAQAASGESSSDALIARSAALPAAATVTSFDRTVLGKGCSFCVQFNFDFKANFDKLANAIAGVASDVHDIENTLSQMAQNFTKEMKQIANGIEDLAKSVTALGADMLIHIVAMRGFLNQVKAEIDLGILVNELQTSIARISHRQSILEPLLTNKDALTPAEKQQLVDAILDINEGSDIDTQIIHDVMTGSGGIVPGVQPAMDVYIKQGYRLDQIAQVYGALFVYQMHGYAQMYWAQLNKRPAIEVLEYNTSMKQQASRLDQQWKQFGSPMMWHCYWDDGFKCPARQECHADMLALPNFACNYATAPLTIDLTTGNTTFTLGAASTDQQLIIRRDVFTGTCALGVRDCSGAMPQPVPVNKSIIPGGTVTNFTCTASPTATLDAAGVFAFTGVGVIVNLTATNHSKYSLFVNETGQLTIVGDDVWVLWTYPSTPLPAPTSGSCPTAFPKRTLKPLSYNTCQCITSARWRRVASANINVTASWCGRLCQASEGTYVASAPRFNGECWCATPEAMKDQSTGEHDCNPVCPYCPGNPTSACGVNNSVAMYSWSSVPLSEDVPVVI